MSLNIQSNKQEDGAASAESRGSTAPLLRQDISSDSTTPTQDETTTGQVNNKPRKRDFWKIGKKQEEDKQKTKSSTSAISSASQGTAMTGFRPSSPMRRNEAGAVSPSRSPGYGSPGQGIHNVSPRPNSPASSMIFERSVQEDVMGSEMPSQIPSHVLTENHIPPALDASTEAITNKSLDPDTVEIITHANHQPAGLTIPGTGAEHSLASSMHDDLAHIQRQDTDNGSNYGSIDSGDVRRLSFISFADVVHAEHDQVDPRRDSAHLSGHAPIPRSPSPIRSPVSSQAFSTSPPTSISASIKGLETSPNRGIRAAAGSPLPGQSSPLAAGGELNIETMRQALHKTGSGDLSGVRSAPVSAIGNDDGTFDRTFR